MKPPDIGMINERAWVDIGVRDAAAQLGVDASRVRQLLRAGRLAGRHIGREWLVSADDVARLAATGGVAGRPMAPARAWALVDLLDGGRAGWLLPVARSQVREVGRRLVDADAARWRAALRDRAVVHRYRAHQAAVRRLLDDPRVRRAGPDQAARAGADLVSFGSVPELYAPAGEWDRLARRLHLIELEPGDEHRHADLIVRVPPVWPYEEGSAPGLAAMAADLLDAEDPRLVSAAWTALHELATDTFG